MEKIEGSFRVVNKKKRGGGFYKYTSGLWFRMSIPILTSYFGRPVSDNETIKLTDFSYNEGMWSLTFALNARYGTELAKDGNGYEARISLSDLEKHSDNLKPLADKASKLIESVKGKVPTWSLLPHEKVERLVFRFDPYTLINNKVPYVGEPKPNLTKLIEGLVVSDSQLMEVFTDLIAAKMIAKMVKIIKTLN